MFDWKSLTKYILEGVSVGIATLLIVVYSKRKIDYINILIIALTASAMFAILDQFSPVIGDNMRRGTGFAVGYQQVGLQQIGMGLEGENDPCVMKEGVCAPNSDVVDPNTIVCKREGDQCVIQPIPDAMEETVEGFDGFAKAM
jgi:hypothetical protein